MLSESICRILQITFFVENSSCEVIFSKIPRLFIMQILENVHELHTNAAKETLV